jgi:hypothetical protein
MATDLNEIKKKVTEDWINAFPQLSVFSQNKIYKVIGSTLCGIELIKLPHTDEYRPHFVVYSLCEKDIKDCLGRPLILYEIYNRKGLQFSIPYVKHSNYFEEAVENMKKRMPISMNKDVTLKELFEMINSRFNDILVKSNSAQQAKLYEFKLNLGLYVGNLEQMQNVILQIQKESKSWNMTMFEIWYGKFDIWFENLKNKVNHREEFLKQIEINKKDKKLGKLKYSELIL